MSTPSKYAEVDVIVRIRLPGVGRFSDAKTIRGDIAELGLGNVRVAAKANHGVVITAPYLHPAGGGGYAAPAALAVLTELEPVLRRWTGAIEVKTIRGDTA